MNGDPIVDTILLALKQGIKTEAEAISKWEKTGQSPIKDHVKLTVPNKTRP